MTKDLFRLLSLYHTLHAGVHAKMAHLKVHHCVSRESISLAWITPLFELYCVAGPNATRNALAQSANKVVQWVRREEERVFIIGGAVSRGALWQPHGLRFSDMFDRFSSTPASVSEGLRYRLQGPQWNHTFAASSFIQLSSALKV